VEPRALVQALVLVGCGPPQIVSHIGVDVHIIPFDVDIHIIPFDNEVDNDVLYDVIYIQGEDGVAPGACIFIFLCFLCFLCVVAVLRSKQRSLPGRCV
jgi:hypothetical protein